MIANACAPSLLLFDFVVTTKVIHAKPCWHGKMRWPRLAQFGSTCMVVSELGLPTAGVQWHVGASGIIHKFLVGNMFRSIQLVHGSNCRVSTVGYQLCSPAEGNH